MTYMTYMTDNHKEDNFSRHFRHLDSVLTRT